MGLANHLPPLLRRGDRDWGRGVPRGDGLVCLASREQQSREGGLLAQALAPEPGRRGTRERREAGAELAEQRWLPPPALSEQTSRQPGRRGHGACFIVEKRQRREACCPSAGDRSGALLTFFESMRGKPEQPAALWPAGREHALEFGSGSEQTNALEPPSGQQTLIYTTANSTEGGRWGQTPPFCFRGARAWLSPEPGDA